MSAKKVSVHDWDDAEQRKIGRINNDRASDTRRKVPVEQEEIGRINNEQEPHLRREILPEERPVGVINNNKPK